MNADAFRQLYDYHISENRKIWDNYIMSITQEQFVQDVDYSVGSIRNHVVHLMAVDDSWFAGLRKVERPEWLQPEDFPDRDQIRAHWDGVEQRMKDYLGTVTDEVLFQPPFPDKPRDNNMLLWQVLIHVANHGTDHRAQMLRLLHDVGVETGPQDMVFYLREQSAK